MLASLTLPAALPTTPATLTVRRAERTDLAAIVRLLTDDAVSASRGDEADEGAYARGLEAILADPGNDLVVATDGDGAVVGTLQLTLIPGMARGGSTRLLVEAVRVDGSRRSGGVGTALMRWVTHVAAPELGAALVQLTSDARRADAHRFYERLGFADSHVGFKYRVPPVGDAGR
ncbi:GNAT family N-acetyltransferase [Demequina rhizosphaerae]|uniref:GNAT family N-acetyltransferase n=1 Tax=Demequina rhizosphaerae TaxID=1638985 RepID=UPI0007832B93|nr:GNAT family N-acetyltransferase [Demequina rhizosphaerae]